MIYVTGLFFVLGLVFWAPAFLAILDMYTWYFYNHNLTGLEYDATRPLVLTLCLFFGVGCMAIAANAGENLGTKYE